jgi:3-hydroxyisobutyrate dehydrogenase-like beta-hydroxyacid dehydrogenase
VFTTLSPALSRGEAKRAAERGARYVEAPVTGSKAGAEAGTLVVMCGAAEADLAAAMPVLQAVSTKQIHVGAVGEAAQVKLIGNMLIAHMMEGLAEGAALAAAAKIPLDKVLEVVRASGYASPYWDFKGKAIQARDFSTHFSIDLMHKDLTLAMATGQALGVPMPGTAAIREVYQLARTQGLGGEDIVATAKVTQPLLGK